MALSSQQVRWKGAPPLDFRYEVTHKPPPQMWEAMMGVTPGMASAGEDDLVNQLEALAASLTGQEAALFLPTTTNGSVLTFLERDVRGQLAIMEAHCHIYWVERFHVSHLSGAAPRPVRGDKFGAMDPAEVEALMTEMAYGYTLPTGMLCLENTHNVYGGTVLTPAYTQRMADLAHRYGAGLFLDGARVFNSAVAQGVAIRELAAPADYVVVSLNKGLGAPMGALLCSSAASIERARVLGKRMGMLAIHKAGLFAAAGIIALTEMLEGLAEDHRRTRRLAAALSEMGGLGVDMETVQTNLLRVSTAPLGMTAPEFAQHVAAYGLAIHVLEPYAFKVALCYAIDDAQIDQAIDIFARVLREVRAEGRA